MAISLSAPRTTELKPRIVVFGVGGAGGNAVNNMIETGLEGCEFVVANTDAQQLQFSKTDKRIQLGVAITQGLGAGLTRVGMSAAEESTPKWSSTWKARTWCSSPPAWAAAPARARRRSSPRRRASAAS
jgi:cell division protein FtsZ